MWERVSSLGAALSGHELKADMRRMAFMLSTHVARLGLPDHVRLSPVSLRVSPRRP